MGIDQSLTATGIAIIDKDENIIHTETIKTDKTQTDLRRCVLIVDRISDLCRGKDVTHVAFEGYAFNVRGNYSYRAGELGGILKHKLWTLNLFFQQVAILSHKKSFTGNGHAKKEDMIAQAIKRYKRTFNEHEADAISLAYHLLGKIVLEE